MPLGSSSEAFQFSSADSAFWRVRGPMGKAGHSSPTPDRDQSLCGTDFSSGSLINRRQALLFGGSRL